MVVNYIMFKQLPIFVTFILAVFMGLAVFFFLLYHLYLVYIGKTTNDTFKWSKRNYMYFSILGMCYLIVLCNPIESLERIHKELVHSYNIYKARQRYRPAIDHMKAKQQREQEQREEVKKDVDMISKSSKEAPELKDTTGNQEEEKEKHGKKKDRKKKAAKETVLVVPQDDDKEMVGCLPMGMSVMKDGNSNYEKVSISIQFVVFAL